MDIAPQAKEVQRLVAARDAQGAVLAYKELLTQLTSAEQAPEASVDTAPKPLAIWNNAKEQADKGITALQSALRAEGHPAMDRIAEFGLAGLSDGKLQTKMITALMEQSRAPNDPKVTQVVSDVVKDYRNFLASDIVKHCDANPFGLKLDLAPILGQALDQIEKHLKT
ncbi:MAG: hypothetical protein COB16_09610 [Rhodobacteraceae bacterium]|nr:MAG: hypothetical protein COB16_09610 [Paracoccaceae bacterium]